MGWKRIGNCIGIMVLLVLGLSGCVRQIQPSGQASDMALDTYSSLTLYGQGDDTLAKEALAQSAYYEKILSSHRTDSLLYQANEAGGFTIRTKEDAILAQVIKEALKYCELTKGAFDITIKPVCDCWNFKENTGIIPDKETLREACTQVDYHQIQVYENRIDFAGAKVELGAIAKGYIADRIRDYLKEHEAQQALLNLGGNVLALGGKTEEKDYTVGIREPFGEHNAYKVKLHIRDLCVVTSGVYERCFEVDDELYHHILNPTTGYPYKNGLYSVTILTRESMAADALSTCVYALGPEAGLELVESLDEVEAILIDDKNQVTYSSGARAYVCES